MKIISRLIAIACLFAALSAHAQNWTTVSAANITDLNQNKLAAGQLCFLATDQNDNPISFNAGGGGQVLKRAFCSPVAAGAVTAFTVPNPANTSPSGIYYRVTVKDSSTGQEVLRYTQVAFTGGTFSFDNYQPNIPGASLNPLTGNSVTGNLNVSGNSNITGSLTVGSFNPTVVTSGQFTSNTASPAGAGILRLASGDAIDWRNNANTANIPLAKTGAASGGVPADTLDASNFAGAKFAGPLIDAEMAAPSGVAASDVLYPDSTAHRWKMINNNGAADTVVGAATTDTLTNKTLGGSGSNSPATVYNRLRAVQGTALSASDFALNLGGSWGSTAAVTTINGTDAAFMVIVTASGTGQGTNPILRITFHDGSWGTGVVPVCMRGDSNPPSTGYVIADTGPSLINITFVGTPSAGNTYQINCIVMGR